jgi:hypothetical protein
MNDILINKDKINPEKTLQKSSDKIDTTSFDETLNLIKITLNNLEKGIEPREELKISEKIKEKITDEDLVDKITEHEIDNSHLKMDELHSFVSEVKIKKRSSFGFYTYLALSIGIIFALYEVLKISKNSIISKYPSVEPYVEYFYEIIEILAYLVMNTVSFTRNLF